MSIRIHEKIANTNTMKSIVKWADPSNASETTKTSFNKLQKHWPEAFMLLTAGVGQTWVIYKSDDMPKKRRIPLIINNIITCSISILGGLITDKYTERFKDKLIKRASVVFAEKDSKYIETMQNGVKTAVPVLISALLYKYIGPVIATPITDKVNKYLVKKGMIDYSKDEKRGKYA